MAGDDDADRRRAARLVSHRDPRAFAELYERHSTYLYRFALRLTAGDESTAEDLVHDAWVRAVERLSTFEWRSTLRTWLAAFVVNGARERARRARQDAPLDDLAAGDEGPLRGAIDRMDLQRALAGLAPGFRMVLVLHDVEGYTHDEIATLLEIDEGTSKSQLSRARAAMRRALGATTSPGNSHVR